MLQRPPEMNGANKNQISPIQAGLGGNSENDELINNYLHHNWVVFEHPLFSGARGWRIAKV